MLIGLSFGMLNSSPLVIQGSQVIKNPKSSAGEITIVTPENKTYFEPDRGYYPATYDFDNEAIGTTGEDIDIIDIDDSSGGSKAWIISEYNGHNNVIELQDRSTGGSAGFDTLLDSNQSYGSFEWWTAIDDASQVLYHSVFDAFKDIAFSVRIWGGVWTALFGYLDATWYPIPGAPAPQDNTWYHVRMDFECTTGNYLGLDQWTYYIWIDGIRYGPFDFYQHFQPAMIGMATRDQQNNYDAYIDAVGYSWDPNYNIGDNFNEGLLLSYDNSTALDWQGYSLDSQVNKTILGNTTIPLPVDGTHSIQVFGNDSIDTMFESNKRYFTVDASPYIDIITPQNKTYTQSDTGYYPATYGFENDEYDTYPEEFTNSHNQGNTTVIPFKNGHHKVALLEDTELSNPGWPELLNYFDLTKQRGTVEFYFLSEDINKYVDLMVEDGRAVFGVHLNIYNGELRYYTSSWNYITGGLQNNTWYHFRIDFECGAGTYMGLPADKFYVYLNGIRYGDYDFRGVRTEMNLFRVVGYINDPFKCYVDAIGYSWDPDYSIGDNLNEGLLLSYDSNINLDWKGYSLDGQANKTILGNKTVPMPVNGSHNIRVYGNTTGDTMYESDIRYFTVNTAPPEITINSPNPSQVVGSSAPSYDLSITGPYDSIWYTFDGGVTNHTASGLTGTLSQSTWSSLSDGIIIIDFYANNSAGMVGTAQVMVFKQTSEEPPPGIPGYDLFLFIGALSIISALLIRRRLKS